MNEWMSEWKQRKEVEGLSQICTERVRGSCVSKRKEGREEEQRRRSSYYRWIYREHLNLKVKVQRRERKREQRLCIDSRLSIEKSTEKQSILRFATSLLCAISLRTFRDPLFIWAPAVSVRDREIELEMRNNVNPI